MKQHRTVAVLATLGFAFLYVPLIVIVMHAFNADNSMLEWGGFTLQWVTDALGNSRFLRALGTSLIIAVTVGLLSVVLAFLGAIGRRSLRPGFVSASDDLLVLVRLVLPVVVIVMSVFLVSRLVGIQLGFGLVVGAQLVYTSAYAFLIISSRLQQLDVAYEDAARDLGAKPFAVFRRVTLPLTLPSIVVAFLMTFTFSLDDVVGPTFLGGTQIETLPTMIMGLIRHGATADVNAIAVLAMLFSLVPLFVALTFTGVKSLSAVSARRKD